MTKPYLRDRRGPRRGRGETPSAPVRGDDIIARLERLESVVTAIAARLGIDLGRPAAPARPPRPKGARRSEVRPGDGQREAAPGGAHAVVRTVARRLSGRIKQYQPGRGYGFAVSADTPGDVFFHRSDCRVDPATLEPGAAVTFDLVEMANGQFKAVNLAPAG